MKALRYILDRLDERSTWVWVAGLAGILGLPALANIDAAAVAAIFGGIGILLKDGGMKK